MSGSPASYEGLLGQLVLLTRAEFREAPFDGFLVAASDQWLVLHDLSDRFDLDGYRCFRVRDVTEVSTTARRLEVVRRAVQLKSVAPAAPEGLDLSGTRALLASVQERFGAVTVSRERRARQECEIGRIRMDSEQTYTLHWLSPDAYWEQDDEVFRYEDVTQVQFGGEYERTLLALAGDPPDAAPPATD